MEEDNNSGTSNENRKKDKLYASIHDSSEEDDIPEDFRGLHKKTQVHISIRSL